MTELEKEAQRGAIVCGLRAGRSNREIADFNNISINTVKHYAREYRTFIEEGGEEALWDIKKKQQKRRSDAHSQELIDQVQAAIDEDPGRSMRKIAADLDISHTLVNKIVKEDIRCKSYSLRRGQFMSSKATKEKRFQKASLLLNHA
jgi:hypothetical protein